MASFMAPDLMNLGEHMPFMGLGLARWLAALEASDKLINL